MFDEEGVVGHGILDTAATIGLIGEETLEKWEQAYKLFGVEDGIRTVNKKTRLRFANSKTKMSKKKVYLKTDVFGKVGWIEAAVVQGNMGLLFSRKCVEDLDITPRLKKGRVYVHEQQYPTVMVTMMNGHAVLPVFRLVKMNMKLNGSLVLKMHSRRR